VNGLQSVSLPGSFENGDIYLTLRLQHPVTLTAFPYPRLLEQVNDSSASTHVPLALILWFIPLLAARLAMQRKAQRVRWYYNRFWSFLHSRQ